MTRRKHTKERLEDKKIDKLLSGEQDDKKTKNVDKMMMKNGDNKKDQKIKRTLIKLLSHTKMLKNSLIQFLPNNKMIQDIDKLLNLMETSRRSQNYSKKGIRNGRIVNS